MWLDTTWNISWEDESHQSFSVEDLVQLTAKYVVIALEFFANIDFSNLSQNDYCNICSFLRESWNKQELRDFLKWKWIETYVHSSMPWTRWYILESENNISLEGVLS